MFSSKILSKLFERKNFHNSRLGSIGIIISILISKNKSKASTAKAVVNLSFEDII